MGRLFAALVLLLLLAAVAAGGVAWWGWQMWVGPGRLDKPVQVVIPRGAGLPQIIDILTDAHLLAEDESQLVFRFGSRYEELNQKFRAGEYEIPALAGPAAIARQLAAGTGLIQHTLTIPEGLTTAEVLTLVRDMPALAGSISRKPAEGALLPETYAFLRDDERDAAIRRMEAAQREALAALWPTRAADLPLKTPEEAVILASVVEKETGLAAERPKVAAVFVNRLRLGMPLQSDPTVIYGLAPETGSLGRSLTRKDLETDHPFNTYTRPGLPKGPICNPGRASLAAVLNPPPSKDLYFVADGSGGHAFAETLADHNRNVAKWRKLQKDAPPQADR